MSQNVHASYKHFVQSPPVLAVVTQCAKPRDAIDTRHGKHKGRGKLLPVCKLAGIDKEMRDGGECEGMVLRPKGIWGQMITLAWWPVYGIAKTKQTKHVRRWQL